MRLSLYSCCLCIGARRIPTPCLFSYIFTPNLAHFHSPLRSSSFRPAGATRFYS
ncbi:hypothetical protein H782_YJM1190H00151 [Saccharomyces cerevisiae YJM1190]|nr:hypothetical protein H762_YJM541H00151 [Saccharomyces cerevisiae YJM541]AJU30212.1 hypothetical protein H764_YJM555H00145 [Saccharomyces cerevisiae YJM555]AJU30720.1 hypothetical protein H766_YJM681H00151 [Saccharomyces cerevisiae YJM681]AJV27562.1 hypothetical protein H781_YJM1133H00151 [Saccharomyces cerevisiae YJM1133]AJV27818.1 hypothetical protein H782_YJM1190H00151 [Saccharomyces cerevisiae YJM1190]AJV28062.1 hypothetical protein H783_YJM1199H00145 [Saccharomyces cerevisiae YJM1199]A